MKTIKFILSVILMMMAMCAQAQTIQVMKDGKVVKEYAASEVDSVVVKPYVDRNVYSDEQAKKVLFANAIQPAGSIKIGSVWDKSKAVTIPSGQTFVSTNTKFKIYNKSLEDTIELNKNCQTDLAPIYYVTDVSGLEFIFEEIK